MKPLTLPGERLIEAEAVLPDGRRIFGRQYLHINPVSGGTEYTLPDSSTVALYHFDDPSPPPLIDSAHGYNLTFWGGFPDNFTNNSWMKAPATTSKAARFRAIGDRIQSSVTIPYSALPANTTGFTIEFRMYPKRLPYSGSALYLFRFAQGAIGNSGSEWSIYYRTDLGALPQFFGPNGQVVLPASSPDNKDWEHLMTPNAWHSVKITVDTAGMTKVYIDDMTNPAASHPTSPGYTGLDWQLSMGDFVGCIDEVRISKIVR